MPSCWSLETMCSHVVQQSAAWTIKYLQEYPCKNIHGLCIAKSFLGSQIQRQIGLRFSSLSESYLADKTRPQVWSTILDWLTSHAFLLTYIFENILHRRERSWCFFYTNLKLCYIPTIYFSLFCPIFILINLRPWFYSHFIALTNTFKPVKVRLAFLVSSKILFAVGQFPALYAANPWANLAKNDSSTAQVLARSGCWRNSFS